MSIRFACLAAPAFSLAAVSLFGCSSGTSSKSGTPGGTATAGCPSGSGFVGDQMCLNKPTAAEGFQLHYGPPGYTNTMDTSPFVLQPGDETIDCYYEKTPNTEDRFVSGYQFYMRPGSHHLCTNIVTMDSQADGFHACGANAACPGSLGGSQEPKVEELTDPAPENQGLAWKVPANSQTVINFHVIDTTDKPILREAWLNYFYMDPSQVKGLRGNLFLTGGVGWRIDPGTHQTYQYACSPDRPVRILSIAAHMHVHATRMSVWHVDTAGQPNLIYENFDWANPLPVRYDTVHTNTPSDRATQTPGGVSGQLVVQPGETLQWECDINNTSNTVLTFRNEVNTGEMCIVTGAVVPADDPMNPYDFTCTMN